MKGILGERVQPIQPQFVDYKTEMTVAKTGKGLPLLYKQNTQDDLFSLTFKYDFGKTADNRYDIAADYMDYLGTKKLTPTQFKQRMYKLACSISFKVSDNDTYFTLSGLNENMPEALALLEDLLQNAQVDEEAYRNMVEVIIKARNDAKTNQQECFGRLNEYGMYGARNSYTDIMSAEQLRNTNPADLVALIKGLLSMQHTVLYYGPLSQKELTATIDRNHKTAKRLAAVPKGNDYMEQVTPQAEVLLAPYDAKNIYMV